MKDAPSLTNNFSLFISKNAVMTKCHKNRMTSRYQNHVQFRLSCYVRATDFPYLPYLNQIINDHKFLAERQIVDCKCVIILSMWVHNILLHVYCLYENMLQLLSTLSCTQSHNPLTFDVCCRYKSKTPWFP